MACGSCPKKGQVPLHFHVLVGDLADLWWDQGSQLGAAENRTKEADFLNEEMIEEYIDLDTMEDRQL